MKPLLKPLAVGCLLALAMLPATAQETLTSTTTETIMITDTTFRHQVWTNVLSDYVKPHADGVNRFDYAGLRANDADRAKLDTYIEDLGAQPISTWSDDEKFAAWANLYNAVTIKLIIDEGPVKSIMRIKPNLFSIGPWKMDLVELEGETVSLDHIEHGLLRVEFDDPRVHYAVNCASIGCPNLQSKAWEAETLDAELDKAARDFVNHPRGVTIRKDGRLKVSSIYKWFRKDFGDTEEGVVEHVLAYAEPELAAQIQANPKIADYDYDWSLNGSTGK